MGGGYGMQDRAADIACSSCAVRVSGSRGKVWGLNVQEDLGRHDINVGRKGDVGCIGRGFDRNQC
jgi:hypothetical protein